MEKYAIQEPQKVLTLKALIEDVNAMERTKMLLDERVQGSLEIIEGLSKEFMDLEGTSSIYEVFFNFKADEHKDFFPNGRQIMDVSEEAFKKMQQDDSLEIIHFNQFNLAKLQNILGNEG